MQSTSLSEKIIQTKSPASATRLPLRGLWFALALIPPIALLFELLNNRFQLPVYDDITFVIQQVAKLHAGTLTLGQIWVQGNDHRMFSWRILALALAKIGGYSLLVEVLLGYFSALLTLFTVWRLLRPSLPVSWQGPALVWISLLLFSTSQFQNWAWGFESCWFISNLLTSVIILMLSYKPVRPLNFSIALGFAVIATYNVGNGMVIWPAFLLVMVVDRANWPWKYIATWIVSALAAYVLYFINYTFASYTGDSLLTYLLHQPLKVVVFFLNYLGAPVAYWGNVHGAVWFGLGLIAVGGWSGGWLWWQARRSEAGRLTWQAGWPWLGLFVFGLADDALITLTRSVAGPEDALTSRYSTSGVLGWVGGSVLFLVASRFWWQTHRMQHTGQMRRLTMVSSSLVLLGLLVSFGFTYANNYRIWIIQSQSVNVTLPFFLNYNNAPDQVLNILWYKSKRIKEGAAILEYYQEGPFAPADVQKYRQEQAANWQSQLQNNPYPAVYPFDQPHIAFGKVSEVQADRQQLAFVHSGPDVVELRCDLTGYYQGLGLVTALPKEIPVEVQAQSASYLVVYYDTGQDFNGNEMLTLAAEEKDGRRYFHLTLPANTRRIQLETHYNTSDPLPEQLRLTFYFATKPT